MLNQFESGLQDSLAPIITDFSADSTTMLLVFGGIAGGAGILPFEFFNLTSDFKTKKIYIKDLEQAWYYRGLPGIVSDIDGIARYLEWEIEKQNIHRLVVCGNSMGGYAALLFGWLLNTDEVHAFSPQTFIGQFNRFIHLDLRWSKQMWKVYHTKNAKREYFDLRGMFRSGKTKGTQFHIYFSARDRLDTIHATRMQAIPNIILHPSSEGGHTLVKHLRDAGLLKDILIKSLGQ